MLTTLDFRQRSFISNSKLRLSDKQKINTCEKQQMDGAHTNHQAKVDHVMPHIWPLHDLVTWDFEIVLCKNSRLRLLHRFKQSST